MLLRLDLPQIPPLPQSHPALTIQVTHRFPGRGEKKEPISPLHIVSARWGIGGDAYKDVTEIVRSHAKPDSVSVPASAGLFGDPYPNTPKQLRVVYSFARQWEVSIKESETLTLPEKLGEEEGNPAQYRERLDALLAKEGEVDRILGSGISDTEYSLFVKVKAAFLALRLCDKVALCRICKAGTISSIELKISLTADGFERPEKSIEILLSKDLVEVPGAGTGIGSGMIRARDPKWVDALLSDNPISLC